MLRRVGLQYETADVNGTSTAYALGFTPANNCILRGMQGDFIFYNSPTFTNFAMRVYDSQNGAAGKLLGTSTNLIVPADVQTLAYADKTIFFTFNDINLKGGVEYFLNPYITGHTFSDSSHIAWTKGWPDPIYRTGVTISYENTILATQYFALVGANL